VRLPQPPILPLASSRPEETDRPVTGVMSRIGLPVVWLVLAALAAAALIDRFGAHEQALARRALDDRASALVRMTLAPGSALACLGGALGDTTEDSCEERVFASPESTAAAVAYMGAEMQWLNDAAAFAPHGDEAFRARFAAIQRAVELDRFGFAAQVLLARDHCTLEKCAAFALLGDSSVLKANMKAQVFNQYVSRYAGSWRARTQAAAAPAVAAVAPLPSAAKPPPAPALADSTEPPPSHHPLSSKYWLPSSDTIPAVSIMNAEPPLPKSAKETRQAPVTAPAPAEAHATPIPPKRPQPENAQAAPPASPR